MITLNPCEMCLQEDYGLRTSVSVLIVQIMYNETEHKRGIQNKVLSKLQLEKKR